MDLLKTILIYMSMVFVSSVQNAPEPTIMPPSPAPSALMETATPSPTPVPTPTPTPVPTPNITPNTAYKNVKVGDKGEEVKKMQRRLAELGYYSGDIDGSFGNQTRRAVERFQYYHGLSADGIAGKSTQTVLYESKDVVLAPADVPTGTGASQTPPPTNTPAPSMGDQPTAARSEKPGESTVAPTFFVPTGAPTQSDRAEAATPEPEEVKPADSPDASPDGGVASSSAPSDTAATDAPEESIAPAETPEAQLPTVMEGYTLVLDGEQQPLTATAATGEAGEAPQLIAPIALGEAGVLVPFLRILEEGKVTILPALAEGHTEYAFALGQDLYRLAYDFDGEGTVSMLSAYTNNKPQVMSQRVAFLRDGTLYLSMVGIEEWTGITFTLNEETKAYTVTFPAQE